MAVPGERAAVVPGHGEGLRALMAGRNPAGGGSIPPPRPHVSRLPASRSGSAQASDDQTEGGADDDPAGHVRGVVGAEVDPADPDQAGRCEEEGVAAPVARAGSAPWPQQNAASVWPLGKLLGAGARGPAPRRRTGAGRSVSGRSRPTTSLMPALTSAEDDAGDAQGPDRGAPGRARRPTAPHGRRRPQPAVVAESGDRLGRGVDRGLPRSGSNSRSTRSSTATHRGRGARSPDVDAGAGSVPIRHRAAPSAAVMPHPGGRRRAPRRPATGRHRRRGRSRWNRQKRHSGPVRGRKSSSRQARSMAVQTASGLAAAGPAAPAPTARR